MPGAGLEKRDERESLVRLMESIRKLDAGPKPTAKFITKKQAARRLGVSQRALRLRIDSGEIDTEKFGRRELIFL